MTVFNDTLANANAYSVLSGSAPSVAAHVMTIPNNTVVAFGSPSWASLNTWQFRFQWATGLTVVASLHWVDVANRLSAQIDSNLYLNHEVGGTGHNSGITAVSLTNGTFYWLRLTQFPAAPGSPTGEVADVQVTLFNDSAGSVGTQVATTGPVPTFDAVTALAGRPALWAAGSAALKIGGNFANVHTVSLFGPGGWSFFPTAGTTGACSGAWDQQTISGVANPVTYPGGPVSSFGAARIDFAPAGTVAAGWTHYTGGSPTGTFAIPATSGQVARASMAVRSLGLHATNASVALLINEYDASGSFLRQDTLQSALGSVTNAGWVTLAGSATLGASCAYIALSGQVADTAVAGESATGRSGSTTRSVGIRRRRGDEHAVV